MGWPVSDTWMDALSSPHTLRWLVSSVRDGELLADNLEVSGVSCTATWDGSQVAREFRFTATDASRELLTVDPGSPLAPWGQRVRVRAELSAGSAWSETIPFGEFRIEEPDGDIGNAVLQRDGKWLFAGQSVQVTTRDMLQQLADTLWTTPVQRIPGNDITAEIGRILAGTGVPRSPAATSSAQPDSKLDYGATRLDAMLALATSIKAVCWCDQTGALALIPATGSTTSWEWTPSADTWVTWSPKASRQDVKNGTLVQSTTASGGVVRGVAWETRGPLRWGGPFGQVAQVIDNASVWSTDSANRLAQAEQDKMTRTRTAQISVKAPSNPAAAVLDQAIIHTENRDLTGIIQAIDWGEDTMECTVNVPWSQLWVER